MQSHYKNISQVNTFDHYKDPYADRRGSGPIRPESPLPTAIPDFHRSFEQNKIYFSWLGHSSVFLHMHGMNILIDPIFSKYASPVPLPMLNRFPGKVIVSSDLPEIDLVLITHNHYDHLDRKTIRSLDYKVKRYLVPTGVEKILRSFGIAKGKIRELYWYEKTELNGLQISLVPSQHFSARFLHDRNRTLWGGYILKDKNHTVYDSGDGGFAEHFEKIREKYGPIDLAILECGQYNERWYSMHMFPEETVEAARILDAKLSVPVHWGAFVLSDHAWDDPPKRFSQRADELSVKYQIPVLYDWVIM